MLKADSACYLCGHQPVPIACEPAEGVEVDCPVCGKYGGRGWTDELRAVLANDPMVRAGLRIAARQAASRGEVLEVRPADFHEVARVAAYQPLTRKRAALLEMMRSGSRGRFGRDVTVDLDKGYPAVWCHDPGEMRLVLEMLEEQKLVYTVAAQMSRYALTPEGWAETEPSRGGPVPGRCFVAMAADDRLAPAFDHGIAPAIDDCGLDCAYVNRSESNGSINAESEYELRRAEVVIADCSIDRGGVYFEAGYGIALGRVVIFTCSKKRFKNGRGVHFDTRHYRHIVWDDEADLRRQLVTRLRATTPSLLNPVR